MTIIFSNKASENIKTKGENSIKVFSTAKMPEAI
jgi:hypothetical protein